MNKVPTPQEESDWITAYLTVRDPSDGLFTWVSALSAAVRDARPATGRNLDTGAVEKDENAGNWLGALAYLVLLDQIGGCFAPTNAGRQPPRGSAFVQALTYFAPGNLSDDDILALYALRCAFAHDFALTNGKEKDTERRLVRRFLLAADSTTPLVVHPRVAWSGKYTHRGASTETRINLRGVGDLVESVVANVQALHESGQLKIKLGGGVDELLARFTLQIRPDRR